MSGERFWPLEPGYGGSIATLRDRRRPELTWDTYERLAADDPPVALWWQLCMSSESDRTDAELPALHAVELRDRCHPNEAGQALAGQALLDFFG